MADKPKLAFHSLACCEGCQLQVLNCEERLLPILERADIVRFREASDGDADHYTITFVEGSIVTDHDIERIRKIRAKTDVLVALGACATIGGVNGMKNNFDLDEIRRSMAAEDGGGRAHSGSGTRPAAGARA